jgi:hypothetical protein
LPTANFALHHAARAALDQLEPYTQARIGGNQPAKTTNASAAQERKLPRLLRARRATGRRFIRREK